MAWVNSLFAAFGLSASAGLNAYIPLLVIALMARYTSLIRLRSPWDALTSPWIIGLLAVLAAVEFLADKIPGVNHLNDAIHTLIRPVAGAIAFAAAAPGIAQVHPVLALAAGLIIAGSVHAVKAGVVRPAVTITTGGLGHPPVSLAEDLAATGVSLLAVVLPLMLGLALLLAVLVLAWWAWRRNRRAA